MPTVSNHSEVFKAAHARMKQRNSNAQSVSYLGKMSWSEALKYAWSVYRVQKKTAKVIAEVKADMTANPSKVVAFYADNAKSLQAARLTD